MRLTPDIVRTLPGYWALIVCLWLGGLLTAAITALMADARINPVALVTHAVVFTLTYLLIALCHEVGHGLAARAVGLPWYQLRLGFHSSVRIGVPTPGQDLIVAVTGPITHLSCVALALWLQATPLPLSGNPTADACWLLAIDAAVNLLPVRGSDGARILQALKELRPRIRTKELSHP